MPKQYRDFHLTPKTGKRSKPRRQRTGRKRYKSVASGFDEHKEAEEDSSKFVTLESQNRVLENRVVDLKNDLRRESARVRKDREEMQRLQSQINSLTEDLNRTVVENMLETQDHHGEGDHVEESPETEESVPDPMVQELAKQNETYAEKMEAMRREIKILRDCQSKLASP